MTIASLGGADVGKDGSRNYAGSGGYVGGLSMQGANWAYWTGAGKVFNKFTPNASGMPQSAIDIYNTGGTGYPTGGNNVPVPTGGGSTGGGGTTQTGGTSGGSGTPTNVPIITTTNTMPVPVFNVPSQPFRGLSQITSGGNQVINSLNALFAALQSGQITLQEALLQGNLLRSYLNNPQVFYQAQHGSDASALQRFRTQASAIINSIMGWIAPTTTTPTSGGVPTSSDTPTSGGSGGGVSTGQDSIYNIIKDLISGGASPRTNIEAPPNLYQFTPDGGGSSFGGGSNMRNIILLAVVGAIGWWLYKKYA